MFVVQFWSSTSTWESLGPVCWYYGDFFLDDIEFSVTYSGIFRYSNNPDSITGFAGVYGAALLSRDPRVICLALLSHFVHCVFYWFVERPHVQAMYGESKRDDAALWRNIKNNVRKVRAKLKDQVKRLKGDEQSPKQD